MNNKSAVLRRATKWALRISLAFAMLMLLLIVSVPIWFPWLARPFLKNQGIQFGSYERTGFSRFKLHEAKAVISDVVVEARNVEGFLPYVLFKPQMIPTNDVAARVSGWTLHTVQARRQSPGTNSLSSVLDDIEIVLVPLRRWLPSAILTDGTIDLGGSNKIVVPQVTWNRGAFVAKARPPRLDEDVSITANFATNAAYVVSVQNDSFDVRTQLQWKRETNDWGVNGVVFWRSNRAELSARIGHNGWWPVEATLKAPAVRLPTQWLGIEGYQDLEAAASIHWETNHFSLDATGTASATQPDAEWPPLKTELQIKGTLDSATLERCRISTPWLQTDLSAPITITREGKLLGNGAILAVSGDLAKCPWVKLTGKINGEIRLTSTYGNESSGDFQLAGEEVAAAGVKAKAVKVAGGFNWPVIRISLGQVTLPDESTFSTTAELDLKKRTLLGSHWQYAGAFVRQYLPSGISYSQLTATGTCSGQSSNLVHSGEFKATELRLPGLLPSTAQGKWSGQRLNFTQAEIRLQAGASQLDLAASFQVNPTNGTILQASVKTLALRQNDQSLYRLEAPCQFTWRSAAPPAKQEVFIIDALHWKGPDERLISLAVDSAWPDQARIQLKLRRISQRDFRDFVAQSLPDISITNLEVNARWDHSPALFDANLDGGFVLDNQHYSGQASLLGDTNGLTFRALKIKSEFAPVLTAEGSLPVLWAPSNPTNQIHLNTSRPFDFHVTTEKIDRLSYGANPQGKLFIERPVLEFQLRGPTSRPEGFLLCSADFVEWKPVTNQPESVKIEKVALEASVHENEFKIVGLKGTMEGQPLSLTAEWPFEKSFWNDLVVKKGGPDWNRVTGRLQLPDAPIAPFTRFIPNVLRPDGRVHLDLSLRPGFQIEGELALTNAATRPLASFTPIHNISAQVRFKNRTAVIENFEGALGGEIVRVTGQAAIGEDGKTRFEGKVRGTNVTLVRTTGLILRADLDLNLAQTGTAPALLSGRVKLHDGLFLMPVSTLVPGQSPVQADASESLRITDEPFAQWRLDVQVEGDEVLRARTPVFNGAISARMHVGGRMGEPISGGDIRVSSGRVRFPFGTLEVGQGYVTLNRDTAESEVFVTASGRNYNYDIRMEVKGPLREPAVTFTSIPSLTSEQVMLMLTAGATPHDEYSYSTRAKVGRLATFLGKDLLGLVGNQDEQPQERLIVHSNEDVSANGKTTYAVEYRLSDHWSVVGEYDRFSAFNAGIKWRIITK